MIINEDFIENGQVPFEYWLMYFSSGRNWFKAKTKWTKNLHNPSLKAEDKAVWYPGPSHDTYLSSVLE